jgi:hypothetical protein
MKKRYLYSILFGVPGFFVSLIISFLIVGGVVGVLWIYFLGDDPWAESTGTVLSILFALTFLIAWIAVIIAGFAAGKKLEKDPVVNKTHILISVGLTLLFILFIVLQQWSVGNIGPKSEAELCNDFCAHEGYSASGMPSKDSGERTCSCFDDSGSEVLKVPLDDVLERLK